MARQVSQSCGHSGPQSRPGSGTPRGRARGPPSTTRRRPRARPVRMASTTNRVRRRLERGAVLVQAGQEVQRRRDPEVVVEPVRVEEAAQVVGAAHAHGGAEHVRRPAQHGDRVERADRGARRPRSRCPATGSRCGSPARPRGGRTAWNWFCMPHAGGGRRLRRRAAPVRRRCRSEYSLIRPASSSGAERVDQVEALDLLGVAARGREHQHRLRRRPQRTSVTSRCDALASTSARSAPSSSARSPAPRSRPATRWTRRPEQLGELLDLVRGEQRGDLLADGVLRDCRCRRTPTATSSRWREVLGAELLEPRRSRSARRRSRRTRASLLASTAGRSSRDRVERLPVERLAASAAWSPRRRSTSAGSP